MKKRIFISIGIPESTRNKLVAFTEEISNSFNTFNDFCPIKWTWKDNLHVTLFFLGEIEVEEIPSIFDTVEEIAARNESFVMNLNSLSYGPNEKNPKMVWVKGDKTDKLTNLQTDLEKNLLNVREPDNGFAPHITLGRITQWEFKRIEPEERPDIKKDISISFNVDSIDVMESELKRSGARYTVLKSFPLK
jgi:2'-5' RNA ligase